jgi:hypothetical protein
MSSIAKKIASIQKSLDALKIISEKKNKKPKKIDDCKTKKELHAFTMKELTSWLKKNTEHPEKIEKKHKKYIVDIVWEYFDSDIEFDTSGSESSSESESSSDSDSDSD